MSPQDLASVTSLLFVPGHRPDRFAKAADSGAGAIILDLEDAVAPEAKVEAREHVAKWLAGGGGGIVRINAPGTPWHDDDLAAVAGHPVMLPKAESAEQVATVVAALGTDAAVLPLVETAAGVLAADEFLALRGVVRAAFGSIDLSAQLGVDPNDYQAFLFARSRLVLASAAAGVAGPVDGVTTDVTDDDRLAADAAHGAGLGFTGKMCIHPRQLQVVHTAFDPTAEELEWARRVVQAAGDGAVTTLDGKMVDKPVVDRARRTLSRASATMGA
ncbi:MAG TPA: CoA ester lyase [Sporichthyaceae bacterium]|jgi:citrate lyase subunit beta/citryl-CoA lyase|nr:CoA ester lyase [Sporichthyaceae bacterium]